MKILTLLLITAGSILQMLSLLPAWMICRSDHRVGWKFVLGLNILFLSSYVTISFVIFPKPYDIAYLIISAILFFGSVYVVLIVRLTLASISEAKHLSSINEYNSHHDYLTGLPNRKSYFERLDLLFDRSEGDCSQFSVLILDLNRFKEVNDALGHAIGDTVLREVTSRLKSVVKPEHSLSRLGGDEFALIVEDGDDATLIAQKLSHSIDPVIIVNDFQLTVDMSVGISVFPRDGRDKHTLLKRADIAMYSAKESSENICRFCPSMERDAARRLQLLPKLKKALENNIFELHYQPIINAASGELVSLESLIRWPDKEEGYISPAEFIPLAEDTQYIKGITRWVINEACQQLKKWRKIQPNLKVNVNLSAIDVQDLDFANYFVAKLKANNLPADAIKLEITESAMLKNLDRVRIVLNQLDSLGVCIVVDDFGVGYSSLSLLRELPTKEIKIDNSFTLRMLNNKDDYSIIQAMIHLAHSTNRTVVVEGVENEDVMRALQSMSCDSLQGYHICRPQDSSTIEQWFMINGESS